jgi:CubicO group peptidase (beta-lactamase class C family)
MPASQGEKTIMKRPTEISAVCVTFLLSGWMALALMGWARKPLDFEPGTKWQYSNTNYVIAGLIVEQASGVRLTDFLQQRIFTPLGMTCRSFRIKCKAKTLALSTQALPDGRIEQYLIEPDE